MMIEVQRADLQALIQERMRSGGFHNAEDVLVQVFDLEPTSREETGHRSLTGTGADLVAAMQASPFKDEYLELRSERSPVREFVF
jgi:hypothetical protein